MVSIIPGTEQWMGRASLSGKSVYYREGRCLSTDTKPLDWGNGSILTEMDTGKIYMFDEQNKLWKEYT